jgi:hypothetical protein
MYDFYHLKSEREAVYLKKLNEDLFARVGSTTFEFGSDPCEINKVCYKGRWTSHISTISDCTQCVDASIEHENC